MSNKEYYEGLLKLKDQLRKNLEEDKRLQDFAVNQTGIKPQAKAVEIVARVYCKYCEIYNKLCDCYDQMGQIQRRPYIKQIIDALTCRILELKTALEEVESFEFTYSDNALQQMIMTPSDVQVICPFFYPFEIRQAEMQYIVDQIFAGNRLGDPEPTPSELDRQEEERIEQERIKREEKDAEIKRKLAMGEEIIESVEEEVLSPEAQEELRLRLEYETHVKTIQRMERSRYVTREKIRKANKDVDLYLELSGLKKPPAREALRIRAAKLIQMAYRKFMEIKRDHEREKKIQLKLGMVMPASVPVSAKVKLEEVKALRRNFRRKYYEIFLQENLKENTRVLRLRKGDIMEDISAEIKQWFQEWYDEVRVFDEYPWPDEGGSILIVQGQTFTIEEYLEWKDAEMKRLKAEAGAQKSKEQIKAEKKAAKEEKKRLELEAKMREKKRLLDYKKQRLNPDNDPGIYINIGQMINPLTESWELYENQWKALDTCDAPSDVIRGHIKNLITENAFQDIQLQVRPLVDEMMRTELVLLRNALKQDLIIAGVKDQPLIKKRKKPKKVKPPKPEKIKPEVMFQALVDEGIIRKYPKTSLDDYWGDSNFAAADMRAVLWTPSFPSPCMGDVREQVRTRCLLTLGCECQKAARAQILVGPKAAGKRTLVYAIATETNSILIDLSPLNVYNKFPGPKNLKKIFAYVNKISRLMQPTVILVDNAEKMFYKKVPKEEKMFDPTRLSKDFFKEIIKPLKGKDKILVLGTASEPWLAKNAQMYKVFPSTILIPRTDYGSISFILTKILMKYHGVPRDFNVHSIAQVLRGFDVNSIKKGINNLLSGKRVAELTYKPLDPSEVVCSVLNCDSASYMAPEDAEMFRTWYESYSPFGEKYRDLMLMLESQLNYKLKAEKKAP